jgi:hypothetical protein
VNALKWVLIKHFALKKIYINQRGLNQESINLGYNLLYSAYLNVLYIPMEIRLWFRKNMFSWRYINQCGLNQKLINLGYNLLYGAYLNVVYILMEIRLWFRKNMFYWRHDFFFFF